MSTTLRWLALLTATLALLCPTAARAAPEPSGDQLAVVSLTTRPLSLDQPTDVIPFQVVVNYRLESEPDGFLLLFLFEDNARSATSQSTANLPIQSGSGEETLNVDYPVRAGVRTLTVMVAMFRTQQNMLRWASASPVDLTEWPGRAAFDKAMAARQLADYEGADAYLSEAIEASPTTGNYYYWRGDTRIYLNQYASAVDDFSRSISLQPDDLASRVGRGVGLLWNGDAQSAVADLSFAIDHSLSSDRLTAFAHRTRGTAYASLHQPALAISDYRAYLAILPDAPDRSQVEGWIAGLS